jgi:hypothetical protein
MSIEYDKEIDGQRYDVVVTYTMEDGLRDGTFVALPDMQCYNKDMQPLPSRRVVATRPAHDFLGPTGIEAVMAQYERWYAEVRPTLPPAERHLFEARHKGKRLWIEEHVEGFTLMFPHER